MSGYREDSLVVVDSNLRFLNGGGDTDRSPECGSVLGAEPFAMILGTEVRMQRVTGDICNVEHEPSLPKPSRARRT